MPSRKLRIASVGGILPVLALGAALSASAADGERFALEVELGPVWQTRNDVRIPNATGTDFSLVDTLGKGPALAFRVDVSLDISERHGLRAVLAPLQTDGTGRLSTPTSFAGSTFAPDVPTDATYKFSSYRLTYRYRFFAGSTWQWRVGLTAFIRDARIALTQGDSFAEDTDVGFVPLLYVSGEARWGDHWRIHLEADALGASQGRAIDASARLGYAFSERWEVMAGYRTIEGGADVEQVYNFAWLHFATGSLRLRF